MMKNMMKKTFKAKLEKSPNKGGWIYVVWPESVKFFGTGGAVKVSGRIEGHPFVSSFMAMGDGQHMLPVKAEIREAIGKDVGDVVTVKLEERIEPADVGRRVAPRHSREKTRFAFDLPAFYCSVLGTYFRTMDVYNWHDNPRFN